MKRLIALFLILLIPSAAASQNIYFPPPANFLWETSDPSELGWDTGKLDELVQWLGEQDTKAFIVLKDGKIAVEEYYEDFGRQSPWYWASAGKTVTAYLIGVLEKEGLIDIHQPVSEYLGTGWTSLPQDKEDLITVWHQLTMTTGLEYEVDDQSCTLPECLIYRENAGDQWYYHNAPYTLLTHVIEVVTGEDLNDVLDSASEDIPGFNATYVDGIMSEYNRVVFSRALDMARFGLLMSQNTSWDGAAPTLEEDFYEASITPSQDLNPSYGYLWWLNGQESFIPPSFPNSFPGPLVDSAPSDMVSALGLNTQMLSIVPSEGLVIVRMGDDPGSLFPFQEEFWERINEVLQTTTSTDPETPKGFRLDQNYPNPFNPSTIISFEIPETSHVKLQVFDATGRLISTLSNGIKSAGNHNINFDASGLSSGVFHYRLQADGVVLSRSMMLVR